MRRYVWCVLRGNEIRNWPTMRPTNWSQLWTVGIECMRKEYYNKACELFASLRNRSIKWSCICGAMWSKVEESWLVIGVLRDNSAARARSLNGFWVLRFWITRNEHMHKLWPFSTVTIGYDACMFAGYLARHVSFPQPNPYRSTL